MSYSGGVHCTTYSGLASILYTGLKDGSWFVVPKHKVNRMVEYSP